MPKTLARGQGMAWMRKRAFIRGYAPSEGGGAPPGFSLWTTNGQVWRFGAQAQRAISPSRT